MLHIYKLGGFRDVLGVLMLMGAVHSFNLLGRVDNEFRRICMARIPQDDGMANEWETTTMTIL